MSRSIFPTTEQLVSRIWKAILEFTKVHTADWDKMGVSLGEAGLEDEKTIAFLSPVDLGGANEAAKITAVCKARMDIAVNCACLLFGITYH